jgi:nucleoside-diphosphate-sugar epimerase
MDGQMKIAVIGSGGFIGRRLVRSLAAAGHEAITFSSSDSNFDDRSGLLSSTLTINGPIDSVVYLSQSPRYREVPEQAAHLFAVNVVSAITAAEWGRRHGARHFLYASSGTVYVPGFHAHPESDPLRRDRWYALSKVHAEEALRQFQGDLAITCARFFGVYGPAQRGKLIPNLLDTIRQGSAVQIQPHPDRPSDHDGVRLSLIHVDDAAEALVKLVEQSFTGPVNVASTDVLSIREIADRIGAAVGVTPVFEISDHPREGDVVADPSRLKTILERPFIAFSSAIGDVVSGTEAAH